MKSESDNIVTGVLKHGVEVLAQGLELKPVTVPVKNVTGWMAITFALLLVGAKFTMDLAASTTLKGIAVGVIVVAFLMFVAALLLQWNRSLLWHRTHVSGRRAETSATASRPN